MSMGTPENSAMQKLSIIIIIIIIIALPRVVNNSVDHQDTQHCIGS